jgi:glucose-1-phosphatase
MKIKNIIFDLGGVLLNIDYKASINAFRNLGVKDFESFFTQAAQVHLFDHLDKGEISATEFRNALRDLSGIAMADEDIDKAWNAMLLDMPPSRIKLIEGVRNKYNIYLLSNTNEIHYPAYMDYMQKVYGFSSLEQLFHKQYLSHEIGMRKPDKDPFQLIIDENNLDLDATLFIDDTLGHVQGAVKAGLHAIWLDLETMQVQDLFNSDHLLKPEVKSMIYLVQ